MDSITVKAPAKINLSLDIVGTREDGYHFLKTVMQAVSLFDHVTVTRSESKGVSIHCNQPDIPCDESNIVYKAAAAYCEYCGFPLKQLVIDIQKKIPAQAGLGGGSADGAAVLIALDKLFDTHLTQSVLQQIGLLVGADVPFCLFGGTALAEGVGEILTPLASPQNGFLVICKPNIGVSTAAAYQRFDEAGAVCPPLTDSLIAALLSGGLLKAAPYMSNAFETLLKLPEVAAIESLMMGCGAIKSIMSGSGSAVFGLFEKHSEALKCAAVCLESYPNTHLCKPYSQGVTLI